MCKTTRPSVILFITHFNVVRVEEPEKPNHEVFTNMMSVELKK